VLGVSLHMLLVFCNEPANGTQNSIVAELNKKKGRLG